LIEFPDTTDGEFNFLFREMLMGRQRNDFAAILLRLREPSWRVSKYTCSWLEVDGLRIMDFGLHAPGLQMPEQVIPPLRSDHVEMINMPHPRAPAGRLEAVRHIFPCLVVTKGDLDPTVGDKLQLRQEAVADHRLDGV